MTGIAFFAPRQPSRRPRYPLAGMLLACAAVACLAAEPPATVDPPLSFLRVHVPRGAIADVPLGGERYVPMSLREFEAAIAGVAGRAPAEAAPAAPFLPLLAAAARYDVDVAADGVVGGALEFDIAGAVPGEMPLRDLAVTRAEARTAAGTGEAVVFGRSDGSFAIPIAQVGTYRCAFAANVVPAGQGGAAATLSLPLVPSVRSIITLRLPEGVRPIVAGGGASVARVPAGGGMPAAWLIEAGPLERLDTMLVRDDHPLARLAVWTDLAIGGSQAALVARIVPATPWTDDVLVLAKDAALEALGVFMLDESAADGVPARRELVWSASADGSTLAVTLPPAAAGTMANLLVEAVAPFGEGMASVTAGPLRPLPFVRVDGGRWGGGGLVLRLDPDLSLEQIEWDGYLAVTPEAASRWPIVTEPTGERSSPNAVRRPTVHVEQQGPAAAVRVAVAARRPDWDVARVTTIDIAPAVVLGRAACDIRVLRGEAFELTGTVAPGWIIDSVEGVEWPQPGEWELSPRRRATPTAGEAVEWKVTRDGDQATLRVGLKVAATPARGLGLRITGHRAGVPLDAGFSAAEIDMVSIDGEAEDKALVAFKTNPDATVEMIEGRFLDAAIDPRLAVLVEDGGARAWAMARGQGPDWEARLVRRRPPLDVQVQVRLTARDDRLTESFTFECRPDTSELDALVVQFSEPMDGLLEWSLLPPATGTIAARRIETAAGGRRDAATAAGVAESWLVEIAPPVRASLTVRAIRTVPFSTPQPVPLAWVDGAVRQVGQVVVRDAGRARAQVLNRRLAELAPRAGTADGQRGDEGERTLGVIGEFSFPSSPVGLAAQETVAEIIPAVAGVGDDARAWAWGERTRAWCHASGQTEYETVYDIENHGRSSLTLSLPDGRRLQTILIDGVRVASEDRQDAGTITIELPPGRRRFATVVRSIAEARPGIGAWIVDPTPGSLDLPVLQRRWSVLVPPELDVAARSSARGAGFDSTDWTERLFAARLSGPRGAAGDAIAASQEPSAFEASRGATSVVEGFRERLLVPAAAAPGGLLVVRRSLMQGLALVSSLGVALASLALSRVRPWLSVAVCVVAALVALWVVSPYETIARGAWWGALAGWWLRTAWLPAARTGWAAAALVACLTAVSVEAAPPAGPATEPLRVFITPVDDGETALVPESLFRRLVSGGGEAAVRVVGVAVRAAVAGDEPLPAAAWRLVLDVDADAGGMLALEQSEAGGRWVSASALVDGRPVASRTQPGDRQMRVRLADAGRHRIEIDVVPAVTRGGDVEATRIDIPIAPLGEAVVLEPPGGRTATAVLCERGSRDGTFHAAPRLAPDGEGRQRHDVSRAASVQLVRSIDGRTPIAGIVRSAESRNDVFWDLDACRVAATFDIDPGEEIVRSVVVLADPRLRQIDEPADDLRVEPLGGSRFLVARTSPERGPVRIEIPFRMPLVDPVGAFDLPQAWLEDVALDRRTTRLLPSPSLAVDVQLPDGVVALPPRETDPALQTHAWFQEAVRAATVADGGPTLAAAVPLGDGGRAARVRIASERREQDLPGTQSLAVRLFPAQTRLDLETRIDASSTPLVALPVVVPPESVIDRLALFEESVQPLDPEERGTIDVRWSRLAIDRLLVVVQRPRAGRFRLELDARVPLPPARQATLPLARAVIDDSVPMAVSWNSRAGSPLLDQSAELFADEPAPAYALEEPLVEPARDTEPREPLPERSEVESAAASDAAAARGPRVELADVEITLEDRGRAWGLARFDMVCADSLVRLRLPPGMRLFDAFVDGHALVPGVPLLSGQANEWELRLHDVRWPRSLLVVFAGELGGRLAEGVPLEVPAPAIVGLPCMRLLWTLHASRGLAVRVAAPAEVVDAATLTAERAAARRRLMADFDRAIAAADGPERDRLREFLAARDAPKKLPHTGPPADETRIVDVVATTYAVTDAAAGQITIRGARPTDPTVAGRALMTLVTLAVGGMALRLARRRPLEWARLGRWFFPGVAAILGAAWLLTLSPRWPGALLLVGAVGAAVREWLCSVDRNREPGERLGTGDETVTHAAVAAPAALESSVTQIAPFPGTPARPRSSEAP